MAAIVLLLFFSAILALIIFWVKVVLEIANSTFKNEDPTIKIIWILFTIFLPLVGSICWLLIGRKSTIEFGHSHYREKY